MADEEIGTIFDNKSADLIAQVTRTVLGQVKNYLTQRGSDNAGGGGTVWHNAYSAEEIPGRSIVALSTEFTWCNSSFPLFKVVTPTTTFTNTFAIVHPSGIRANGSGWITFTGPCEQRADSAIVKGDKLGPKPGFLMQFKNYPATSVVDGVVDSSSFIYYGPVHRIGTFIGQSSTAIAVGNTTNWRIRGGGTPGSESDIGVETPSAYCATTIAPNVRLKITPIGNGLEIEPLACST